MNKQTYLEYIRDTKRLINILCENYLYDGFKINKFVVCICSCVCTLYIYDWRGCCIACQMYIYVKPALFKRYIIKMYRQIVPFRRFQCVHKYNELRVWRKPDMKKKFIFTQNIKKNHGIISITSHSFLCYYSYHYHTKDEAHHSKQRWSNPMEFSRLMQKATELCDVQKGVFTSIQCVQLIW